MIQDLAIILLTAGISSLVCKMLKQPVVLGYIIAGLLVGPYVAGASWVSNEESVKNWGQVGVIFLLFTLGLGFSFKKLIAMGSTVTIGSVFSIGGVMSCGFLIGQLMGWDAMNSLFMGGMLCMTSSTIIFKALDEMGLRQQKFAGISLSISLIEDLFGVLLIVLLSSIAVNKTLDSQAMIMTITKLAGYLLFWFVAGIFLIPSFLRLARKYLNDEILTIVSLGLCLGMVLLALSAGFSESFGAFVMGSILAETLEGEHIERVMSPIKNMFGAVFFVSVGMMIDPASLIQYWLPIVACTLVIFFGQTIFTSLGVLLAGQPLKVAMQTGFAIVQVGEFAFIIAALGVSTGVTSEFLYPVIVAVSVITTFITPYSIKLSLPAYTYLDRVMPSSLKLWLANYAKSRSAVTEKTVAHRYWQKTSLQVAIYFVVCLFVETIYFRYINDLFVEGANSILPDRFRWVGQAFSLLIVLAAISPLLYKLCTTQYDSQEFRQLWREGVVRRVPLVMTGLLRLILALGFIHFAISRLFSFTSGVMFVIVIIAVVSIFFSRLVKRQSSMLEERFIANLSARERALNAKRPVGQRLLDEFADYDLHLADFEITSLSDLCGQQLQELDLRRRTGVNVVRLIRDDRRINIPSAKERIFPGDRIVVAGLDSHIQAFKDLLDRSMRKAVEQEEKGLTTSEVIIDQFVVSADMPFCGKPLMQSHISDGGRCTVLSIEHDGETIVNPSARTLLQDGDLVVLAGEKARIRQFLHEL